MSPRLPNPGQSGSIAELAILQQKLEALGPGCWLAAGGAFREDWAGRREGCHPVRRRSV